MKYHNNTQNHFTSKSYIKKGENTFYGIKNEYCPRSKYYKMQELNNVEGFVVNIHDPTNFDIDFGFNDDIIEKYHPVISNKYIYKDLTDNFKLSNSCDSEDISSYMIESFPENPENTVNTGISYRCHLRGITINQLPQNLHNWKSNQLCIEIKNLVDRSDGWVNCTLTDIDIYKRLLIDITINTLSGPINICEYLLSRVKDDKNPIFVPYKTCIY